MLQNLPTSTASAKSRQWVGITASALILVGGVSAYAIWRSPSTQQVGNSTTAISSPQITTVTALGRLEPQGEIIKLSAPTANNGNRVEQLLVKPGDRVKVGQAIAILDSRDRLFAAYQQAQEDVKVAQAKLAITKAGAKTGEINAQRAEIDRLEAQRQGDINAQTATVARLTSEQTNAMREYNRYQSLYQKGAISASDRDSKQLALETAQKSLQEAKAVLVRIQSTSPAQLNQARANLERISEVRPVDVKQNQAEVDRAVAAMKQAKAELDRAYVRSPMNGEILEIHTHAGEVVGNDGIIEIGQTERMYAVAEVYQSDISKVKLGQKVRISSDSIPGELLGKIERIDSQVRRQNIINTDPSTNIDARVVEVHIALDAASSKKAAKFSNLQITAQIEQ
ncbi:ABC exporter membrane fusion protein [Dendronalium sp. ChiSLP03b]|uniref:ABC exporter membrane fusion protein n=1 Tax=Dendronalium sp. ChiSLP03b TaxID=3075381 RepID=UPI002AD53079|nr:ABC exporter membrane fusion protein [Dendronalium sp. ChiSLP03b]MDZ8203243.1 ABC exporter membrane fusion protein [Dendronalium sp. ChiSLP03b]